MAGAVGFEPMARGFGVNPRPQRLRAIFLRKQQHFNFTKIPKSQNDAILMIFKNIVRKVQNLLYRNKRIRFL